jgi:hypothetical protein
VVVAILLGVVASLADAPEWAWPDVPEWAWPDALEWALGTVATGTVATGMAAIGTAIGVTITTTTT